MKVPAWLGTWFGLIWNFHEKFALDFRICLRYAYGRIRAWLFIKAKVPNFTSLYSTLILQLQNRLQYSNCSKSPNSFLGFLDISPMWSWLAHTNRLHRHTVHWYVAMIYLFPYRYTRRAQIRTPHTTRTGSRKRSTSCFGDKLPSDRVTHSAPNGICNYIDVVFFSCFIIHACDSFVHNVPH